MSWLLLYLVKIHKCKKTRERLSLEVPSKISRTNGGALRVTSSTFHFNKLYPSTYPKKHPHIFVAKQRNFTLLPPKNSAFKDSRRECPSNPTQFLFPLLPQKKLQMQEFEHSLQQIPSIPRTFRVSVNWNDPHIKTPVIMSPHLAICRALPVTDNQLLNIHFTNKQIVLLKSNLVVVMFGSLALQV